MGARSPCRQGRCSRLPRFTVTPAQLAISAGTATFEPARFAPTAAVLTLSGQAVAFGNVTAPSYSVTTPKLDRLARGEAILDRDGGPSVRFQLLWQQTMQAIEDAFAALTLQVGDNTSVLAAIQNALNLATAANDNAVEAISIVNIANSFTEPSSVLTASSDGTITVAPHTRVYGNGARVSVDGGTISGFSPGQFVRVYYDDAARDGGAVEYHGATADVVQQGNRHVVGGVEIPALGAVDQSGTGVIPPGWVMDPMILAGIPGL